MKIAVIIFLVGLATACPKEIIQQGPLTAPVRNGVMATLQVTGLVDVEGMPVAWVILDDQNNILYKSATADNAIESDQQAALATETIAATIGVVTISNGSFEITQYLPAAARLRVDYVVDVNANLKAEQGEIQGSATMTVANTAVVSAVAVAKNVTAEINTAFGFLLLAINASGAPDGALLKWVALLDDDTVFASSNDDSKLLLVDDSGNFEIDAWLMPNRSYRVIFGADSNKNGEIEAGEPGGLLSITMTDADQLAATVTSILPAEIAALLNAGLTA